MGQKATIQQIADTLIQRLSAEGFTIQRYNAYSTNSVYLKLDYGVANSIRISDHRGKKHLKYMYNIWTGWKGAPRTEVDGFTRHYYHPDDMEQMIQRIVERRAYKLSFGRDEYLEQMESYLIINADTRGFWSKAETVHEGTVPTTQEEATELNQGVITW